MSKVKIVTDSSCDLNKDIIEKYNIGVVGLNVSFGDETYIDGEMDNKVFYERMANTKDLPKTSCSSPEKFAKSYECEEEEILVITITSKLSATYSTAVLARTMYLEENANKNIAVLDSETGSVGHGLLVVRAAQLAQEGKTLNEIIEEIEKVKNDLVFFGSLETLENAIKGGRINPIAGKIINALNFKVIIQVTDGIVKPVDKARGDNNSIKKVVESVSKKVNEKEGRVLAIGHSDCLEKALKVKEMMLKENSFKDVTISEVGSVMGTYTSKGAILLSIL
ncbi:MAG: DegV family protein [Romboutsia sp.]|uniref:DegV family protein n=1 Tax=Romboutsia sp. TaxID=1965302 RepID=UPI003F331F48